MAITIGVKREYEFTGNDNNNDPCLFPRDPVNPIFVQSLNFKTKIIATSEDRYLAFPFVTKVGSTVVGLHSDSNSHASGTNQYLIVSSDDGATWQSSLFLNKDTGVIDPSGLSGILSSGQSVVLKSYTVKNVSGVLTAYTTTTVSYGGLTYALWSRAVSGPSGKLFRTGYAANGTDTQTALFQSTDGGVSWSGVAVMFSGTGLNFSEADIVNTSGSNWFSVVREDSGEGNPLYYATSTNNGSTWSSATAFPIVTANGRQPNLTKMTDGSLILATGDRSGSSGYGAAGNQLTGFDSTGITVFRSTDNGSTWGYRTRVSPMYSTDGGQPMVVETDANRALCVFYSRRTVDQTPMIGSASFDVANL